MPRNSPTDADVIDLLRSQWESQLPHLDTEAMEVVGRITLLASRWEAELQRALKPFALSYTDFDIIATLRRSGEPYELTPTELLQSVVLTSGAMTTALTRLEKAGLLSRTPDPSDGRVRRAKLTRSGAALAAKAARVRFNVAGEQVTELTNKDQQALVGLLRKMVQA
ncbi:MAG: MarR family transcriptional regulator [Pseudomonadota bacterium]